MASAANWNCRRLRVSMPTHAHRLRLPPHQPRSCCEKLSRAVDRSSKHRPMNPPNASAEQLTVIIPTLNEAANIQRLVARIFEQNSAALQIEVLFVDDGSTDGTCERVLLLAQTQPVRLLRRERPAGGLAGAVLEGARMAKSRWILVMDADLSHPPERIGDLAAPLLNYSQDMVIGSRYVPGGRTPGWPWWRRFMSRMACLLARPLTRAKDPLSGFFATERASLIQCGGDAAGFKIALEIIVNAKREFRVKEIPIVFRDRERGGSKMRFGVLATYLLRLMALLLRRAVARLGYVKSPSLSLVHDLPKTEN
jgi:dolichol-phosphate mannosyltransferase